jgi:hypothetical protein
MQSAAKAVIIPAAEKGVDLPECFAEPLRSKPAEPLGPFEDLTLNSGGFFLPGCFRVTTEKGLL